MTRARRSKRSWPPGRHDGNGKARTSPYQEIKRAILTGVLRPLERITEARVAERLGLSRTPIREAFGRLAAEGLIAVVPQRGSFVSQLSLDHVLEMYQIRTPLECMAARIAAEVIDGSQLAQLERLVEMEASRDTDRNAAESLAVNAQFHEIIIACARNRTTGIASRNASAPAATSAAYSPRL